MPRPCPGANCCDEPPAGPCGCSELTLVLSNFDTLWKVIFTRFSPGPCNYLSFQGVNGLAGTYTITLGASDETFELARVAATNNPLEDDFFNEYCLFVRLRVEYQTDPDCFVAIFVDWKYQLLSGDSCSAIEDVDFTGADSWSLNNNNSSPNESACSDTSGSTSIQTYDDPDPPAECADQYFGFDYVISYA